MDKEGKKARLEALLDKAGFSYEFVHTSNIAEPILLIQNYAPHNGKKLVSFAFTLQEYYANTSGGMGRKCWMTWSVVKKIDEIGPSPHSDYKEFDHRDTKYFPFSVDLTAYTYNNIASIKELCRNLYEHLDFSQD